MIDTNLKDKRNRDCLIILVGRIPNYDTMHESVEAGFPEVEFKRAG